MSLYTDKLITIVGPTATGKTGRAVALAEAIDAEIISADSRQVYRRMDLGTGKDIEEYGEVPVHLIDICEPGDKYNLHRFIADFKKAEKDIRSRGKNVIMCGGTGMYAEAVLSGIELPDVPENPALRKELEHYDLETLKHILEKYKTLHNSTDVDTKKRAIRAIEIERYYEYNPELAKKANRKTSTPLDAVIIGVDVPREVRRARITKRLDQRLEAGMVDEVRGLLAEGIAPEDLIYYGLEYKFLTLHAIGKLSFEEMRNQLEIAIHQFAKRQMTWLRGMERRGFHINWIDGSLSPDDFTRQSMQLIY